MVVATSKGSSPWKVECISIRRRRYVLLSIQRVTGSSQRRPWTRKAGTPFRVPSARRLAFSFPTSKALGRLPLRRFLSSREGTYQDVPRETPRAADSESARDARVSTLSPSVHQDLASPPS